MPQEQIDIHPSMAAWQQAAALAKAAQASTEDGAATSYGDNDEDSGDDNGAMHPPPRTQFRLLQRAQR